MAVQDEDAAGIGRAAPGGVGLLVVDMINHLDFPEVETLRDAAQRAAEVVLKLRDEADRLAVPVVYVNDTSAIGTPTRRRSSKPPWARVRRVATWCFASGPGPATSLSSSRISGFYSMNLPALLPRLGVDRLVLTGVAADICVLFTAADAHMREYGLWVPADAVAGEAHERTLWALDIMNKSMGAETRRTDEISLAEWIGDAGQKAA